MFGGLAALLLVASFIIPINLATPSPVEAGICKWDTVDMPGSVAARADLAPGSEIQKLVVGNDGKTILAIVKGYPHPALVGPPAPPMLATYLNLIVSPGATPATAFVFDVAIAPDNPAFWAVVTGHGLIPPAVGGVVPSPIEVWITENSGGKWERTQLVNATAAAGYLGPVTVGAIDISVDYGGQRDIAVGMRNGAGGANLSIFVLQSQGFTGWQPQITALPASRPGLAVNGDFFALRFSPSYPADGGLATVFTVTLPVGAANIGTRYNVALRDIDTNTINQWTFPQNVDVCDPAFANTGVSPTAILLITADLELPSDFNGQAASLRRAYVSTDSGGAVLSDGIFRMDNTTVYMLMDTWNDIFRRIATITYFGTYASGKLLAGSVLGWSCSVSVPTWFTDSPTTCPIPCWYECLKCPTGAGVLGPCTIATTSAANAQVVWFQGGDLALAATGTYILTSAALTRLPMMRRLCLSAATTARRGTS
jgi:hypothetical protein